MKAGKIVRLVFDIPDDWPSSVMANAKHKRRTAFRSLFVKDWRECVNNLPIGARYILFLYVSIYLLNVLHIRSGDILGIPVIVGTFMSLGRLVRLMEKKAKDEQVLVRDRFDPGIQAPLWNAINGKHGQKSFPEGLQQ